MIARRITMLMGAIITSVAAGVASGQAQTPAPAPALYTRFRVTYHTHRDDKNKSTWLGTDIVRRPSGEHIASTVTIDKHFKDQSNESIEIAVPPNIPIEVSKISDFGIHIEIRGGKDTWYFNYTVEALNSSTRKWDAIPGFVNRVCNDAEKRGGLRVEKNGADGITEWF